jgi:hypothetical protein
MPTYPLSPIYHPFTTHSPPIYHHLSKATNEWLRFLVNEMVQSSRLQLTFDVQQPKSNTGNYSGKSYSQSSALVRNFRVNGRSFTFFSSKDSAASAVGADEPMKPSEFSDHAFRALREQSKRIQVQHMNQEKRNGIGDDLHRLHHHNCICRSLRSKFSN